MSKPVKVGVCVGHSRSGDRGAESVSGLTEHAFNSVLGKLICHELSLLGIATFSADRYEGAGYGAAMKWIAGKLDAFGVTHAIELHFNASEEHKARGHEWLHWHSSAGGKKLAQSLHDAFAKEFPEMKDRGLKPIQGKDRGGLFLSLTRCPAVIIEPFFGDNAEDWKVASSKTAAMAKAIAAGIANAVLHPKG